VRTLNVTGDVTVGSSGKILLGSGVARHQINLSGNFTNNGKVILTGNDQADYQNTLYTTTPYAQSDVYFINGTQDQYVQCNNQTDFYRIVVNKGSDQTYILNIDASNTGYFHLYGRSNYNTGTNAPAGPGNCTGGGTPPNLTPCTSLALYAGTCRLGPNIGSVGSPILLSNAFFWIDADCELWLDGAQGYMTSSVNTDGIYNYGILKLTSNATLLLDTVNFTRGYCMRDAGNLIVQDNAILTCAQIRMSTSSPNNRGGFNLSDNGVVNVSGVGAYSNTFAAFSFSYSNCTMNISGGTVNIRAPVTVGVNPFSLDIQANASSQNITGGTFNITIPTGSNAYISSTMPFWNLNINGTNGANYFASYLSGYASAPYSIVVLNNLTLNHNAILRTNVTGGAPAQVDLYVGNNLIIPVQ
jgi:hypothetical protein